MTLARDKFPKMTFAQGKADCLRFLKEHPNSWHSFHEDAFTARVVTALRKKGYLITNSHYQMRASEAYRKLLAMEKRK
jgi:hypothetical protein